jgi:hypothetical protein
MLPLYFQLSTITKGSDMPRRKKFTNVNLGKKNSVFHLLPTAVSSNILQQQDAHFLLNTESALALVTVIRNAGK